MATLTIRDLDDSLKRRLRVRAASRNRSMEEEVRQILRAALLETPLPSQDLASRVRARLADLGDVELIVPAREPLRTPPSFSDDTRPARAATPRARSRTTHR